MSKNKTTMSDVAKAASVSLSTVSLVFSGRGRVSREVREGVLKTAERLGYDRKSSFSTLPPVGARQNVGLLLHMDYGYLWHFFQQTISTIESILAQNGYNLLLIPIEYKMEPQRVLRKIEASGVSAVFSLHYAERVTFTALESRGIPVVLLHNNDYQDRFFTVSFDDLQGSYEGTLHLIRLGHRRIGYVEYAHRDLFTLRPDRFYGFMKAMEESGISFDPSLRVAINYATMSSEEVDRKMTPLFAGKRPVTALFVHDDYLAERVVAALAERRLTVPRDVSIVAPGDVLDYREPFVPQITTMKINTALIGKIAAEMMLHRFASNPPDIQVLKVKEQLIERGSCRNLMESAEKAFRR
jgi:LacI family transcriptional regulator